MNYLTEMFTGAYQILFPKSISKKYNRDRLGRFSIKRVVFIGSPTWKELIGEHMEVYE